MVSCLKLLRGYYQWIQAYRRSGMSKIIVKKYGKRSIHFISKETSLQTTKKYKNRWQVKYGDTLKEEKSVRCRARDLNLGPLVYEASALSIELSFWMKIDSKLMTIYTLFVVQQMLLSLTYPFKIVRYASSNIVEYNNLNSLVPRQHCIIKCDIMLD